MKKTLIVVLGGIMLLSTIIILRIVYISYSFSSLDMENLKNSSNFGYNNDNMPDYLKDCYANEKIKELLKKITFPKDIFSLKEYEKILNTNEAKIIIPNNLDSFCKNIELLTIKNISSNKNDYMPTLNDYVSFPQPPSYSTIKNTAIYWSILSRFLESKSLYNDSLLLSHFIFYLSKDLETNYIGGNSEHAKYITIGLNSIACNSILVWASKPKPKQIKLSKQIAKNILKFVENEYPISRNIEAEGYYLNFILKIYSKKNIHAAKKIQSSDEYKRLFNLFYEKQKEIIDKPFIEGIEKVKKLSSEIDNTYDIFCKEGDKEGSLEGILYAFFKPTQKLVHLLFYVRPLALASYKYACENKLAKMEITAIALVINAYVCEKNKYPQSIEELSKWFGKELPKNRFTGKDYELDFNGGFVIYNNGPDGKNNYLDSISDDSYFKFFKK